jgi:ParB-like nuclease domain
MLKEIPLTGITIGERFRKDLGDIEGLAKSIETVGLLHPIVVTTDYALIVGRRRLAAYKHLGREMIPALVIDLINLLSAEHDENEIRKDLTKSEQVEIAEAILGYEREEAKKRHHEGSLRGGKEAGVSRPKKGSGKLPEPYSEPRPQARDIAAAHTSMSPKIYSKARVVVEAAKADPDLQELVEKMDKTGNVSAAYREIPSYIFEERPDLAPKTKPKKERRFSYRTLAERLDSVVMNTVLPQVEHLNDEERANLRKLLESYVAMFDAIVEDMRHAAAD